MSDATLRELERAWRASGDPADEARWHAARVRAGELAGWAWELVQLLRRPLPAPEPDRPGLISRLLTRSAAADHGPRLRERLREVLATLDRESPEGFDRALIALGAHAAGDPDTPDGLRPHLRIASDELAARLLAPGTPEGEVPAPAVGQAWGGNVLLGLHARLRGDDPGTTWLDQLPFPLYSYGPSDPPPPLPDALPALARELEPWLLGLSDPLRERAAQALDRLQVASPCEVPWESMAGDAQARRCGQCQTTVYDLGALDRAAAEALLRRHEGQRVCVNFYRRADGRIQTRDCPREPFPAGRAIRGRRA